MHLHDAFFRELPEEKQFFDYGVRTDGQPVYFGHASLNMLTSAPEWILSFFKYNVGNCVTEIYCLKGSWDNRVALFVGYV